MKLAELSNGKGLVVYTILSIFFVLSSTQNFKFVDDSKEYKTECYMGMELPYFTTKIAYKKLIAPDYIQMVAEFDGQPKDSSQGVISRKSVFDMMKVGGDCDNSLLVSSKGNGFSHMNVTIKLYTNYGWGLLSEAKYTFKRLLDTNIEELSDETRQVKIGLRLRNNVNQFLTTSLNPTPQRVAELLDRFSFNHKYICVIAQNQKMLIIRPSYIGGNPPTHRVGGIKIALYRGGSATPYEISSLAAFGCSSDKEMVSEDLVVVSEPSDDLVYALIAQTIGSPEPSHTVVTDPSQETRFTVSNARLEWVENFTRSGTERKAVFLNEVSVTTEHLSPTTTRLAYVSKSQERLFSNLFELERFTEYVHIVKMVQPAAKKLNKNKLRNKII